MHTQEDRCSEKPETADNVLVGRALGGDQDAFEMLVSCYKYTLFALICHYVGEYHTVEDILQHVWLQLCLSLDSLRRYTHIRPWLITVARNRCLDFLRHKQVLRQHLLFFCEVEASREEDVTFQEAIPDMSPTPEELAELYDIQSEIQRAIEELPQTYRPVVWLFYGYQLKTCRDRPHS